MAIQSFRDKGTEAFFETGKLPKRIGWCQLSQIVLRKLDLLHYATTLASLKIPPKNCLEALKHDLNGFYSIRVNDQWRVIFRWTGAGPSEVYIDDYH